MADIYKDDFFYVDLSFERIEWVYYNPDSTAGGQFVSNFFEREQLAEALSKYDEPKEAFDYVASFADQYLSDVGTEHFNYMKERMETEKATCIGCGQITIDRITQLFEARDLINAFCIEEYRVPAIYDNLQKVSIGYTTTEDEHHEIQAYANLIDYRLETYLDGKIAQYQSFESLSEMIRYGLTDLSFDELVSIPDWVVQNFEESASMDKMATRIALTLRDIYPERFEMLVEENGSLEDVVGAMKLGLKDPDIIADMTQELFDLYKEFKPTGKDAKEAVELMKDLNQLFIDKTGASLFSRELDVMLGEGEPVRKGGGDAR